MDEEKVLTALATLSQKVDSLARQVDAHNTRLKWITSIALVVIGAVGGPNAVSLITAGATS